MTVLCGVGGSEPKPGSANDVLLTTAILEAILSEAGLGLLAPFVGYLGSAIQLSLPTFCALDPPADPGLSGADILALITLGPGPLTAGPAARFVQLIQRYAWFDYCQCSAISTPSPPSPPTITDVPAINPAGPPIPAVPPCFTADFGTADLGFPNKFFDFTWNGANPTQYVVTIEVTDIGVDSGAQHWITLQETIDAPFGENSFNTQIGMLDVDTDARFIWPHLAGGLDAHFDLTTATGTGDLESVRVHVDVYCNGNQPGQSNTPCCPPDPILTAKLDNILALVTLLQRQTAPFAYVVGTAHTALSGSGSISVQGLLGIHTTIDTPDSMALYAGVPDVHLRPGRVNFGTADGYQDRHELVIGDQLIFPSVPGVWTTIGYTLADGVTLSIEELAREP
jgi:hypothetical protein